MPSFYLAAPRETLVLSRLRMVAAVASFIIYASAVVAVQQPRENFFYCERIGLAAAVSNIVYHAPFGKVYPAVETTLLDMRAPAGPVFDKAKQLGAQPGDPVTAINDGDGAGFIVVATWAVRVFGPHLLSIPLFALGLMAISAAMFLWLSRRSVHHRDNDFLLVDVDAVHSPRVGPKSCEPDTSWGAALFFAACDPPCFPPCA